MSFFKTFGPSFSNSDMPFFKQTILLKIQQHILLLFFVYVVILELDFLFCLSHDLLTWIISVYLDLLMKVKKIVIFHV